MYLTSAVQFHTEPQLFLWNTLKSTKNYKLIFERQLHELWRKTSVLAIERPH